MANTDCTVVRVPLGRGVTEELWIAGATHLVRKSEIDDYASKDDVTFTGIQLGVSVVPELVSYSPEATQAVNGRQSAQHPDTMTDRPAPDITLRDLDSHEVRLRDLRGKLVLLDFWATWCGYCRQELPIIELLYRSLQAKGLIVFGVDDEAPEIARRYLEKYGYTMPSLVDSAHAATRAFLVNAWPTTVLIDREGKVTFYQSGAETEAIRDALRAVAAW